MSPYEKLISTLAELSRNEVELICTIYFEYFKLNFMFPQYLSRITLDKYTLLFLEASKPSSKSDLIAFLEIESIADMKNGNKLLERLDELDMLILASCECCYDPTEENHSCANGKVVCKNPQEYIVNTQYLENVTDRVFRDIMFKFIEENLKKKKG